MIDRSKLDDRMKVLLRKIRAGETSFSPVGESDEARREFDRQVKCLIALREQNLIPTKSLLFQREPYGEGFEFSGAALVRGLTYEGEVAADELDMAPAVDALGDMLSHPGLLACRRDFERAVASVASDPSHAIAAASSTLESVCKAILSQRRRPFPSDQSIQPLMKETMKALDLAPENAAEDEIRRVLGAVGNIAAAVGTLRTKYGTAHGRTNEHTPLTSIHARFAVNAMAAGALFLLESAINKPVR